MFYCQLVGTKALRGEGGGRTQDFFFQGFFHRCERIPPVPAGFGAGARRGLSPAGAAGRKRGRGTRRAPWAAGLCHSCPARSRARRPQTPRPPTRELFRAGACARSTPLPPPPAAAQPGLPHTHRWSPGTVCVCGEPRCRSRSRCSASPAASRALTAAARVAPPLRPGTGREPPVYSVRFPSAHRKARGQRPPAPECCYRWSAAHLPGCCCCHP